MDPITNLNTLIKEMTPELDDQQYCFCTTTDLEIAKEVLPSAFAIVREVEGTTLILPAELAKRVAKKELETFARIELKVYSSLEAVGLTAAFSQCLKNVGISANVIAGFYHDHILVPWSERHNAMVALQELSKNAL